MYSLPYMHQDTCLIVSLPVDTISSWLGEDLLGTVEEYDIGQQVREYCTGLLGYDAVPCRTPQDTCTEEVVEEHVCNQGHGQIMTRC